MDTEDELRRELRRLRLELAAERGEDGPWTDAGWRWLCGAWLLPHPGDVLADFGRVRGRTWAAGVPHGSAGRGECRDALHGIELVHGRLGLPIPWEAP